MTCQEEADMCNGCSLRDCLQTKLPVPACSVFSRHLVNRTPLLPGPPGAPQMRPCPP